MSTYFDFTIERPYRNEWICVGQSFYDENLDIINPWILKGAFWDADFSEDMNALDEKFSNETFYKFAHKKNEYFNGNKNDYDLTKSYFISSHDNSDIINFLNDFTKTKYKCNDVCLWFDLEYICQNKDFLKSYLCSKAKDLDTCLNFQNKINSINNTSEFKKLFEECNNIIIKENKIGIVFHETSYSMRENIKYCSRFQNLKINGVNLIGYYEDDNLTEKKQYEFRGHVSYKKDIEYMISEIDKTLVRIENSKKSEEIAKSYIASILEDYEYDEDMKNNELYKRLYDYSKDSEEYDDEYADELIAQKYELELILRFIGDNGRIIWNIE